MRGSSKFPIAVHSLTFIAAFGDNNKITSEMLSKSIGVNAVTIRNLFSQLKKAGLIAVSPGPGGVKLGKNPEAINLLDIYQAVESIETDDFFKFHETVSPNCPVGGNIYDLLHGHLEESVAALKRELTKTTLKDLITELREKVPDLPAE